MQVQDRLEIIQAKEKEQETIEAAAEAERQRVQSFVDASVADMYGTLIYDRMQDPEMQHLMTIPGVEEVFEAFKINFNAKIESIGEIGLQQHKLRKEEERQFFDALKEVGRRC